MKSKAWIWTTLAIVFMWLLTPLFMSLAKAANNETQNVGSSVALGYKFDRQTTVFRDDVSTADTAATTINQTNLDLCGQFGVNGRKNVTVSARFSAAAATISVMYVACYENDAGVVTPLGLLGPVTLTAPAAGRRINGLYTAETYVFDSLGGNTGYVVITTGVSSGTADLWVGSY